MPILKDLNLEDIIYRKELLIIITPSSIEKGFMTNPSLLILIYDDMKKLEN